LSATELNNAEFDKSVLNNLELLKTFVDQLNTGSRRERQSAALVLSGAAQEAPEALLPYKEDLLDALNRPEAQTRWEVLDALSQIVKVDSTFGEEALEGAETALFDETSGPLRLSAVKFLCSFGALSP
jgi:HEAT repeat protein